LAILDDLLSDKSIRIINVVKSKVKSRVKNFFIKTRIRTQALALIPRNHLIEKWH
jgi:hypothetical protein